MTAVLDLFSCAGGATTGIAILGRKVVGIDHDPDACATHLAAGHPTIRADLTESVPVSGPFELVWASPPCTAFSMAGKGAGREVSDVLVGRILAEDWEPMEGHDPTVWLVLPTMAALLDLRPVAIAMENVPPTLPVMHACARVLERHGWHTAVGVLSAERFGVAQTRKRAFLIANRERRVQMPEPTHQGYGDEVDEAQGSLFGEPLLPWISMADALGWGSPERPVTTLTAGSKRQGAPDPLDGGSGARKTMKDLAERESWVVRTENFTSAKQGETWQDRRYERPADEPAPTVGSRADQWDRTPVAMDRRTISRGPGGTKVPTVTVPVTSPSPSLTSSGVSGQFVWRLAVQPGRENAAERDATEPAPSVAFGHNLPRDGAAWTWGRDSLADDPNWPDKRPATTVQGDQRIAAPGHKGDVKTEPNAKRQMEGSISISVSEAARLQAFPNGHPWQGSRTSIFRQVGNAVPPPVAAAVAGAALGIDWCSAVADYLAELYGQPLERTEAA